METLPAPAEGIREDIPDVPAGIPGQFRGRGGGGNGMDAHQAFVCGRGLPGGRRYRRAHAGSHPALRGNLYDDDGILHALLWKLHFHQPDGEGRGAGSVPGEARIPAVSRDHAEAGRGAAAAGLRGRRDHDRPGMGQGRAAGDSGGPGGISVFHGMRHPADVQYVSPAPSAVLLDRGHQGRGGTDFGGMGFQQHAPADLRKMDAADRDVSSAGVRHHQFPGAVPHGRALLRDDGLGSRVPRPLFRDHPGGVEAGGEKLQLRQLLTLRKLRWPGSFVRRKAPFAGHAR